MIDPKELRIGNILQIEQSGGVDYIVVDGLRHEDYHVNVECRDSARGCYSNKHNDLQLVPITPEILEKCGFSKGKLTGSSYSYYQYGDFSINEVSGGFEFFGSEWTHGTTFHHLHQLQNLYFALWGEELEVKL